MLPADRAVRFWRFEWTRGTCFFDQSQWDFVCKTAQVNVGSLTASTKSLSDVDTALTKF